MNIIKKTHQFLNHKLMNVVSVKWLMIERKQKFKTFFFGFAKYGKSFVSLSVHDRSVDLYSMTYKPLTARS